MYTINYQLKYHNMDWLQDDKPSGAPSVLGYQDNIADSVFRNY